MILAAWNVNSLNVRLPRLLAWLAANRPDVICLQETKLEDPKFPVLEIAAAGYTAHYAGQKTYNGVAILVRSDLAASDVAIGIPGFADEQKRVIAATVAGIRVVGVYVPNGQALDSDKYGYKLAWYAALADMLRAELARHPGLAVLGDFNVAPEDRDVHDPALWAGQVLCSDPERAAFRALLDRGLGRQLSPVRAAGEDVLVVGLPAARISEESRAAHRPHPAVAAARCALHGKPDRPQRAQGREAVRSRAGAGGAAGLKQRWGQGREAALLPQFQEKFSPMVFASPIFLFLFLPLTLAAYFVGAARLAQRRAARREPRVLRMGRGALPRARPRVGRCSTTRSAARSAARRTRARRKRWLALGVAGNLDGAGDLQVRELRGRQRQRARARARDHAARGRVDSAAARHFLLHVPRDLVRGRRVQAQRARRAQPAALRALHPAVSAADRRADHPLARHRRAAARTRPAHRRLRLRRAPLRAGPRQEGADRQHARPHGRPDLRAASGGADHTARVARPRLLHAADLLRLLRLFGHGDRPHAHVRLPHPREFQLSVHRAQHPRVLAALAHLAVELVPRLPVHSARRQPARRAARLRQSRDRVPAVRTLARRELAVRAVGRLARRVPGRRARRPRPRAAARRPLAHVYALLAVMGGWVLFRCETLDAGAPLLRGAGRVRATATRRGIRSPEFLDPFVLFTLVVGDRVRDAARAAHRRWRDGIGAGGGTARSCSPPTSRGSPSCPASPARSWRRAPTIRSSTSVSEMDDDRSRFRRCRRPRRSDHACRDRVHRRAVRARDRVARARAVSARGRTR